MPSLGRSSKTGMDLYKTVRGRGASRRFRMPRWARFVGHHRRAAVAAVTVAGLTGACAWGWHAGTLPAMRDAVARMANEPFVAMQVAAGLVVNDVTVEGRAETAGADLLGAVGVGRGDLLLGFDPEAARKRVESLGWVRTAVVSRRLPDHIHVEVTERVPFALWQSDRRLVLIDRDGAVITDRRLGQFSSLPMIVGADAGPLAGSLIDLLDQAPALRARVRAAVRVSGRRWDVHFDNGMVARLPEESVAAAWARLDELQTQYRLLDRAIQVVDLRIGDRLALRLESVGPPRPPATKPKAPPRPA